MAYRILGPELGGDRVILEWRAVVFTILAAVFLLIGLFAGGTGALAMGDPEVRDTSRIMLGFGLIFGCGGVLLLVALKRPRRLVFDNEAAVLRVVQRDRDTDARSPALPYSALRGFRRRRNVQSSNGRRSVTWDVLVDKDDGLSWTLFASLSEERSAELLAQLEQRVRLDADGPRGRAHVPSSGTFDVDDEGEETRITWKKRQSAAKWLLLLLVLTGFAFAVVGFRPQMSELAYFFVSGFLGLMALLAVASLVTSLGKSGVIRVSSGELRVSEAGGLLRRGFDAPLFEVAAVSFTFSPNQGDDAILVLNEEERETFERLRSGGEALPSIGDAMALVGLLTRTRKIRVGELTTAEKLELELLIEQAIRERSGREGL